MDENQLLAESNQFKILEALADNSMLRFKDLEVKTGLSPPTLAKRLKELERRGIVKKTRPAGRRWPYYTIESAEHLREFILPQFFWVVLDERYPEGTSMEKIAETFGAILMCLLFMEEAKNRNHTIAIKGIIGVMRNSVKTWVDEGINIKSKDFDRHYTRLESLDTPEELRRMVEELL